MIIVRFVLVCGVGYFSLAVRSIGIIIRCFLFLGTAIFIVIGILGGNIRCQDFGHIVAEHYYIIAIFGDIGQDNLAVHAELRASHEYQLTVNRLVAVVDILLGLLIDELDVNILDAQFRIPEPDILRLFHQRL